MKILFKNVTKYSEENYNQFLDFHASKFGLKNLLYFIFVTLFLLWFIYLEIKENAFFFAFIIFLGLILFYFFYYFKPQKEAQKSYNSPQIQEEESFSFIFYEHEFKITSLKEKKSVIVVYNELYKIFDTENFFYFYLDDTHSYIIDKKSFVKGNSNEVSEYFKRHYFFKYKKVK